MRDCRTNGRPPHHVGAVVVADRRVARADPHRVVEQDVHDLRRRREHRAVGRVAPDHDRVRPGRRRGRRAPARRRGGGGEPRPREGTPRDALLALPADADLRVQVPERPSLRGLPRHDRSGPTTCEVCGAEPLQRVLHPVAVHYKGSGFYSTDYGRGGRKPKDGGSSDSSVVLGRRLARPTAGRRRRTTRRPRRRSARRRRQQRRLQLVGLSGRCSRAGGPWRSRARRSSSAAAAPSSPSHIASALRLSSLGTITDCPPANDGSPPSRQ